MKCCNKADVHALKQYMTDLSDAVREAAAQGKCFDAAMKEIKLSKYEKWGSYAQYLPAHRAVLRVLGRGLLAPARMRGG